MTNMTIWDFQFFNFGNSTRSIFSEALDRLKTMSDDRFEDPRHDLSTFKSHFFKFYEVQNQSKSGQ